MAVKIKICFLAFLITSSFAATDFNPFAAEVINISLNGSNQPYYLPAPGQRINVPAFNQAEAVLGSPVGGGTFTPNNDGIVTLGGFGGQIVLAFDHDVENNPANPMGLDAIVFSNTLWYDYNQHYHWAEFATIEIMPERSGNNIPGDHPDEIWYVIRGSFFSDPCSFRTQTWNNGDSGYPIFSGWPSSYQTSAFEIFPLYQEITSGSSTAWTYVNPNSEDSDPCNDHLEGAWGYAEYTPSLKLGDRDADNIIDGFSDANDMAPELFYTIPDDPYTVGISLGACGGDAFDIDWAVDPNTWQPANLETFRYVRLTTAVQENLGILGEVSAEIDAVSDVRSYGDVNGDNEVDYVDMQLFAQAWLAEWSEPDFNPAADFVVDNKIDFLDYSRFAFGYSQ